MLPEDTPNPPEGFEWKDNYLSKKKKKSFMEKGTDSLRNMTKNMKTGDWIFLLGTLGLAAANPKGRGGQAKVIQHNLDKSRELGVATAKSALSRVRNYVIPKLQKTETDVIAMREFITKDLKFFEIGIVNFSILQIHAVRGVCSQEVEVGRDIKERFDQVSQD